MNVMVWTCGRRGVAEPLKHGRGKRLLARKRMNAISCSGAVAIL